MITLITMITLMPVITLIIQMNLFQDTGFRHRNLILYQQMIPCIFYQKREICSLLKEDKHSEQDHRVDYDISVINRNQRNQSDLSCSEATLQFEVPKRSGDLKQVPSAI